MNVSVINPLILGFAIALTGCSLWKDAEPESEPREYVSAPFASGAVTLKLNAYPDLNQVSGMANSCTLLFLQAKDDASLDQVLASPAMLKALFAGSGASAENGNGLLQVDRYTLMPGQSSTLHIDRVMSTRSVAIVAGYYPFPDKKHMLRFSVPIKRYTTGWWNRVEHAELLPLAISATLGRQSFVSVTPADDRQQADMPKKDMTESGDK